MADLDIAVLVLSEHEAFRRSFTQIESTEDAQEAGRLWRELADALEVHAAGEEAVFYPALLREVDDSEGDTEHAVKDHNEIREATAAVDEHEVGSDAWRDGPLDRPRGHRRPPGRGGERRPAAVLRSRCPRTSASSSACAG